MEWFVSVGESVTDARDIWDLWYAFVIGIPATIAAVATLWGQRKARDRWNRQERVSDEIRFEVRNDHKTNLRDDITELKTVISQGFKEIRQDVHQIREELSQERKERIEGDRK